MTNAEKYHFADFTTDNYNKLLRLAKNKFQFRSFTDYNHQDNFVIWRHDVDFSMHRALKLARIEAEENIKSTYCVLLHSEFYNLLEKEITDLLHQIISLGHHIGLHFDSHYYNIYSEAQLEEKLIFEKKMIETLFQVEVQCFSFHITNPFTVGCKNEMYGGMVNCFSDYFQTKIEYCSDSNGYWRFKRLENVLLDNNTKQLQVLTHPELWQDEIMSPKKRVYRCADERAMKMKIWYDNTLANNNRNNID